MPSATADIKLTCEEITAKMQEIMDRVMPAVNADDMSVVEKYMKAQMATAYLSSHRVRSQHEWHWTSGTMRPARKECKHCQTEWKFYHD